MTCRIGRNTALARTAGLSLVELMVALVLGLLIVGAVIQVFTTTRLTYSVSEGLGRVQENARFAMEFLQRDLRMAGSVALCGTRPGELEIRNWVQDANISEIVGLLVPDIALRGWEYAGTATGEFNFFEPSALNGDANQWSDGTSDLPVFLRGRALPGSDVLGLRVFDVTDPEITGCTNNAANSPSIGTCPRSAGGSTPRIDHGVGEGTVWAAVDCSEGAVDICRQTSFGSSDVLNCAAAGGNVRPSTTDWAPVYQQNMELYLPRATYFYVGQNPAGQRALFRAIDCAGASGGGAGCRVEELVEGVDSLQLFYRVANDNALYAANALPGNDWSAVRGVAVSLVVSSPDEVDGRRLQQDFTLDNGLVFRTNDRRVRQVYPATIAIRNSVTVH